MILLSLHYKNMVSLKKHTGHLMFRYQNFIGKIEIKCWIEEPRTHPHGKQLTKNSISVSPFLFFPELCRWDTWVFGEYSGKVVRVVVTEFAAYLFYFHICLQQVPVCFFNFQMNEKIKRSTFKVFSEKFVDIWGRTSEFYGNVFYLQVFVDVVFHIVYDVL